MPRLLRELEVVKVLIENIHFESDDQIVEFILHWYEQKCEFKIIRPYNMIDFFNKLKSVLALPVINQISIKHKILEHVKRINLENNFDTKKFNFISY